MSDERVVSINKNRPIAAAQLADVSEALQHLIALMDAKGMKFLVSCVSGWDVTLTKTEACMCPPGVCVKAALNPHAKCKRESCEHTFVTSNFEKPRCLFCHVEQPDSAKASES